MRIRSAQRILLADKESDTVGQAWNAQKALTKLNKVILWDFDGTLGYREGGWTGAILQALDGYGDLSRHQREDIRPHLQSGFPWHDPSSPHTHIKSGR